jgi:hypothetical protein
MTIKEFKEQLENLVETNVISKEEKYNIEYECALIQTNKSNSSLEKHMEKIIYQLTHEVC